MRVAAKIPPLANKRILLILQINSRFMEQMNKEQGSRIKEQRPKTKDQRPSPIQNLQK